MGKREYMVRLLLAWQIKHALFSFAQILRSRIALDLIYREHILLMMTYRVIKITQASSHSQQKSTPPSLTARLLGLIIWRCHILQYVPRQVDYVGLHVHFLFRQWNSWTLQLYIRKYSFTGHMLITVVLYTFTPIIRCLPFLAHHSIPALCLFQITARQTPQFIIFMNSLAELFILEHSI